MEFDEQRFEALVLYIAFRRRDDERFGRVKLAKSLFYSDFAAYQDDGQSITGATYIRLPKGPFPKPLETAENSLESAGQVVLDYAKDKYEEKRIVPTGDEYPPDLLNLFEQWQLFVVNDWVDQVASASANRISELSHKHPGWLLAGTNGAEIPYETALLPQERPTGAEARRAEEIARERGWLSADGEWLWERGAT